MHRSPHRFGEAQIIYKYYEFKRIARYSVHYVRQGIELIFLNLDKSQTVILKFVRYCFYGTALTASGVAV